MNTLEHLERLIAFDTISHKSNLALISYVEDLLRRKNIHFERFMDETGEKANLFATIGPVDREGVILSAHSDVVPVEGQNWNRNPFKLTRENDRFFGRGTTDMKGFLASCLALIERINPENLTIPIHLALSHDEETGCVGARTLVQALKKQGLRARFCIVGEPTSMDVAIGHKGRLGAKAKFQGVGGHSAMAPHFLNPIYMAGEFIDIVRQTQAQIVGEKARDHLYEIPYTTLHIGTISSGVATNVVPRHCLMDFEIRNISQNDADSILQDMMKQYQTLLNMYREKFADADLEVSIVSQYPGFETEQDHDVVKMMLKMAGDTKVTKVPYGTEAGLFAHYLNVPTVVCGPGSMDQGHTPDEFIELEQLIRCDEMLERLHLSISQV